MTSDYALLLGFPPHVDAAVLACRKLLVSRGCQPSPFPGGLILGNCHESLRLNGRDSHPLIDSTMRKGWRFGMGKPVLTENNYGLTITPADFFHVLRTSHLITGEPAGPDGFLPLVTVGDNGMFSGESVTCETNDTNWTKIILKKVLLEYPLGREHQCDALVWTIVEERTLIPDDPFQR